MSRAPDAAPEAAPDFPLDAVRAAIAAGAPVTFSGLGYTRAVVHGRVMHFATTVERDPIQRNHREGRFYEEVELEAMKRVLPFGGTFVDIGANVGNHGLYAAAFLGARVIPFEPNPPALRLLIANVLMNGLEGRFDLAHLGIGLSDRAEEGYGIAARERNLGGAQMQPGQGALVVLPGDLVLAGLTPHLVKIDVEGMEMRVLDGLAATLARARPWLMVEVDEGNEAPFHAWVERHAYAVDLTHQRYKANRNYVLRPLPPRALRRLQREAPETTSPAATPAE
jgi:FkbM family methyltransferase